MSVQARHDEFVQYVVDELNARGRKLIRTACQWHEYRDGYWTAWTPSDEEAFDTFLLKVASPREFPYSTSRAAIWNTLRAHLGAEKVITFDEEPAIVALNGTYFLKRNELRKHAPEHYVTRRVDIEIDGDAGCPLWLETLDRIFEDHSADGRRDIIQFLQEWIGVAVVGARGLRRDLRKAVFLYGEKRTGKSSITDVLMKLLGGHSRVASSSVATLSSRFGLSTLIGKSALITSEAANTKTEANSLVLKNLITGDPQTADVKNEQAVPFEWHGPVVFTTNTLPRVDEDSSALYDRSAVVEFTRQFDADDADKDLRGYPDVVSMLEGEGELPGILNWAMDGYVRAVERDRYIVPKSVTSATEKYRRTNDAVYDFAKSCLVADKNSACSSEAVSIACIEYGQSTHDKRLSMIAAHRAVSRVIRDLFPKVVLERSYYEKDQFRAYGGLRLTDTGVEALKLAEGKPYPALKRAMRRVNYKYG